MDISKALESTYINAELVSQSPTKKLVILDEGSFQKREYDGKVSDKFELIVEIDRKRKTWSPNKDTIRNLIIAYGKDSTNWIGKIVNLQVSSVRGKFTVTGMPMPEPIVTTQDV